MSEEEVYQLYFSLLRDKIIYGEVTAEKLEKFSQTAIVWASQKLNKYDYRSLNDEWE